MGLGEEFVQRFLVECVRDARKCLADLDAAGRKASWEEFRDACHALKGAAGNMGAIRLADTASEGMRMASDRLLAEWSGMRSEEHPYELQSLMRTSYAVLCLKKKPSRAKHLGNDPEHRTREHLTEH